MPRVQLPEKRRQVHHLDRGHGAHIHRAAQRVLCGAHGVLGRLGGVQGGPSLRQQRRARPGEPDLLRRALEQRATELALQGADRGGHPGLHHVQPTGGTRETQLLGDRDEVLQLT
ncbi:hypothetical protein SAV31267_016530 [Streptomyces avermitilis]|uniref:Uncharacterized protein n=1 Tax=Streptomyces avermitilis TaxID=33903 RepID=A0A4D4MJF5_STRAX|nr:hypothetical protein SAV31267_016530 [Streptomyces avermitilis]